MEAARALEKDWRFARVAIRVFDGNVENAIQHYSQGASPEMIFIETDTTDSSFIGRLDTLSGLCNEKTSAIVIGPVNDVNLYRSLTAIGVSDYLVIPVPEETLSEVIATTLIEKLGTSGSRLIAVIGAKGGVGTTALAQAMAWASADQMAQKTLLLDAAGAWSTLPVGMGFEPVASTAEAIKAVTAKDHDSLRRMLYNVHERLFVLATGTEPMLEVPAQITQFEEILNMTMASHPVVIADLSGAIPSVKKTILTRAHEIVVVTTPTLPALRSARALIQEIKKIYGGHSHAVELVVNMAGLAPGKEVSRGDIKTAMECDAAAVLPFDPKLFIGAENEGKRISLDKAGAEIIEKLMPLLQKITQRNAGPSTSTATEDGLFGGIMNKFKAKK